MVVAVVVEVVVGVVDVDVEVLSRVVIVDVATTNVLFKELDSRSRTTYVTTTAEEKDEKHLNSQNMLKQGPRQPRLLLTMAKCISVDKIA